MNKNFHGWFEKVEKGVYKVSQLGEEALVTHKGIVEFILSEREGHSHD